MYELLFSNQPIVALCKLIYFRVVREEFTHKFVYLLRKTHLDNDFVVWMDRDEHAPIDYFMDPLDIYGLTD